MSEVGESSDFVRKPSISSERVGLARQAWEKQGPPLDPNEVQVREMLSRGGHFPIAGGDFSSEEDVVSETRNRPLAAIPGDDIFDESLEREDDPLQLYRGVLSHIGHRISGHSHGGEPLQGSFQGYDYSVKVTGHHATVGVIDLSSQDGSQASFILRGNRSDAKSYLDVVRNYPQFSGLMPQLLGVIDGWTVIERLYGLSGNSLHEHLQSDPKFETQYAQNAAELLVDSAQGGLFMPDVSFKSGHNVMVDPKTASIMLIEQTGLQPAEKYNLPSVNERIAWILLSEFRGLVRREWVDLDTPQRRIEPLVAEGACVEFVFQLTKAIAAKVPLENLRSKVWDNDDEIFTPEIIEAVQGNDYDAFLAVLMKNELDPYKKIVPRIDNV